MRYHSLSEIKKEELNEIPDIKLKEILKQKMYPEWQNIESLMLGSEIEEFAIKLKEILKQKMYPEWQNIESLMLGSEIEEFALKLKELAKEFDSKNLLSYAEDLFSFASEFDIEDMEKQFRIFEKWCN